MFDLWELILLCAFIFLIKIIIIAANLTIVLIISTDSKMKKPSNFGILSIASADLLFVAYSILRSSYSIYYYNNEDKISRQACIYLRSSGAMLYFSTLFIPVAVAVDRFLAVCYPIFHFKRNKSGLTKWILISVWITSILFGIFCFFNYTYINIDDYDFLCLPKIMKTKDVYQGCVMQIFCIIVIVVLYIRIFAAIRNQVSLIYSFPGIKLIVHFLKGIKRSNMIATHSMDELNLKVEVRAAKTMSLIVGSYVLCWIPATIYFMFIIAEDELLTNELISSYNKAFYAQFTISIYLCALIDPFIYAYRSKDIRDKISKFNLLWCRVKTPAQELESTRTDE